MMFNYATELSVLEDITQASTLEDLPPIQPHFFVPRLLEKPQNPILDALKTSGDRTRHISHTLPPELSTLTTNAVHEFEKRGSLWAEPEIFNARNRSKLKSWDALRSSYNSHSSPTPFLSEQAGYIFAASRYHVLPLLQVPSCITIYVAHEDLYKSLRMIILGTSSPLYTWDHSSESFLQAGIKDGKYGGIVIEEMDEVISESIMKRFLTIGICLRRLDTLVLSMHSRTVPADPTLYAFVHTLAEILDHLRHSLADSPLFCEPSELPLFSTLWMQYREHEEALLALTSLCQREIYITPPDYAPFDPTPTKLLERLYSHLSMYMQGSPRHVTALLAYLLTKSSTDYFDLLCGTVGIGPKSNLHGDLQLNSLPGDLYTSGIAEHDPDEEDEEPVVADNHETDFPEFFSKELVESLPAAQRSLKLLKAACPDHPLLTSATRKRVVAWIWTEKDIKATLTGSSLENIADNFTPATPEPSNHTGPSDIRYQRELEGFQIFDLEPGSQLTANVFPRTSTVCSPLQNFLASFPESLPTLVPTLKHLADHVLSPLLGHSARLSKALLTIFLSLSSPLNFHGHLVLLRSYLLLTSHSFKTRLAAALFSDFELLETAEAPDRSWAVGLAPTLAERNTWPPGVTDLSFSLRTVIVDSLGLVRTNHHDKRDRDHSDNSGKQSMNHTLPGEILQEAEYRLGFVIRDLPVGKGIEAFDFLYLDYRPPRALETLMSPEILSKYQRMFKFLLRLMRVEGVIRALFRMTRHQSSPLFPTLASSNKLLLHFRFYGMSFVTSLSSYIYDTVIGGYFDAFLSRLAPAGGDDGEFLDIFSLAASHSTLMDDILSACLLRSGQAAVGVLLQETLEVILDFGVLCIKLKQGRLEEYQAALLLEDQVRKFRRKMKTLTKVLKALVERGSGSRAPLEHASLLRSIETHSRQPLSGNEVLYNLFIRLDLKTLDGTMEGLPTRPSVVQHEQLNAFD